MGCFVDRFQAPLPRDRPQTFQDRPLVQGHSSLIGCLQERQRAGGIVPLVATDQAALHPLDHMRAPSIHQSPVASPLKREFSTKTPEWCGAILSEAGQDLFCLRPHPADHHRHAGLNDPTFFKGNGLFRRSQILLMIHADRRNRTGQRLLNHIGRVKPSPQPNLKDGNVHC